MDIYALSLEIRCQIQRKIIAQNRINVPSKSTSHSSGSERDAGKAERGSGIVSLTVSRSIGTHGESKAFEESATYEANEDEPSFEQRDFHECP